MTGFKENNINKYLSHLLDCTHEMTQYNNHYVLHYIKTNIYSFRSINNFF